MGAPAPRSVLALDVGRRRIGLAGCDPLGLTVNPLPALARGRFPEDVERLLRWIQERDVKALVVGLPLDADSELTSQARHCQRYGLALQRALASRQRPLPLAWVNEHSSSWAAADQFGLHGDRSGRLDSAAAALLLHQWLREGPEPAFAEAPDDPVATATIDGGAAESVASF